MRITNGSLAYSHVVKVEDYGVNKKAEVSLSFVLEDNDEIEPTLEVVGAIAQKKTHELLGKAMPAKAAETTTAVKRGRPAAEKAATMQTASVDDGLGITPEPEKTREVVETKAKVAAPDELSLEPEQVAEITDKELSTAANRAAEKVGGVKVRGLMNEYWIDKSKKFGLADMPQIKRGEFLKNLEQLQ